MQKENHQTYLVSLWMDSDEEMRRDAQELTRSILDEFHAFGAAELQNKRAVARGLKAWILDGNPLSAGVDEPDEWGSRPLSRGLQGLYPDLLSDALEGVDWSRIARSQIDAVRDFDFENHEARNGRC